MKKYNVLVLVLLVVLSMVACSKKPAEGTSVTEGTSAETSAAGEQRVIKIAHCAPDQDVAQKEFSDCIKANIRKINEQSLGYTVEYTIFNAQYDQQAQIGHIETVMVQDFDVLIVFGVDSEGTAPVVKQAHEAGLIVIDICNLGYPDIVDMIFFGNNELLYADLRDQFLDAYLKANPELHLNTGVIYGSMNQLPQLPRGDRMLDYAEENPDRVTILDNQTGEWYADKAMSITEDWMQTYPNMNFVCSANDQMTVGIVQALKSAGKLDDFLITSVDCTDEALEMVSLGEIGCTIGVDNYDYAVELIDVAIRLALGETFDKEYYMENIRCITKDNVEEYIKTKAELKAQLGN